MLRQRRGGRCWLLSNNPMGRVFLLLEQAGLRQRCSNGFGVLEHHAGRFSWDALRPLRGLRSIGSS